jgi:hypothetical protein
MEIGLMSLLIWLLVFLGFKMCEFEKQRKIDLKDCLEKMVELNKKIRSEADPLRKACLVIEAVMLNRRIYFLGGESATKKVQAMIS